jgi:hypothetical protein
LDHHFGSGAFFDDEQVKYIVPVYLADNFVDLNVLVEMLGASSASKMDETITMCLALRTKVI